MRQRIELLNLYFFLGGVICRESIYIAPELLWHLHLLYLDTKLLPDLDGISRRKPWCLEYFIKPSFKVLFISKRSTAN